MQDIQFAVYRATTEFNAIRYENEGFRREAAASAERIAYLEQHIVNLNALLAAKNEEIALLKGSTSVTSSTDFAREQLERRMEVRAQGADLRARFQSEASGHVELDASPASSEPVARVRFAVKQGDEEEESDDMYGPA
jgi:hypothetical protein